MSGRVAVMGGATARTGEAVLRAFLDAGFRVLATARRPEALRETLARLPGGEGIEVVGADLLDPAGAERVVAAARERFGRVDAMTTLASGGFQQRPFAETSLDDLRRLVEGNLYMTYKPRRRRCAVVSPR